MSNISEFSGPLLNARFRQFFSKIPKNRDFSRMPKLGGDSADPQESLMNMMKQMYDEGDDEMKRTLRKAWHEAQSKKGGGGPGGDGMMGMDMGGMDM